MRIYTRDIKADGVDIKDHLPVTVIGFTEEDDLQFEGPLDVAGRGYKTEDVLAVDLSLTGKYSSYCWRCLEPIHKQWKTRVTFDVPIHKNLEYVELDEDIRQEVLLHLPSRIVCREECKGLCPGCGKNLNQEECKCKVGHKAVMSPGHKNG